MEEYRRPIKINRYWNRPQPKVYECNLRDAERIYKANYKEYLAEKDFRLRGSRDWSTDTTDRFAHLRAGPVRRREASVQPYSSRYDESSSVAERVLSRASVGREAADSDDGPTFEAKAIPAYDPQKENQSLEERLARLKRLREDLGLPSDTESSKTTLRESTSRSFASDNDSSYKSERSSRLSSRTSAAAATSGGDESSSYSFRSERASKMNGVGGGSSDDYKYKSERSPQVERRTERRREEVNLTPKVERKSLSSKTSSDVNDEYSFSSKSEKKDRYSKMSGSIASSSSPVRSRRTVATTEKLELDDEDDESVVKMMKKLPSSQEILERISKMDLDD